MRILIVKEKEKSTYFTQDQKVRSVIKKCKMSVRNICKVAIGANDQSASYNSQQQRLQRQRNPNKNMLFRDT
jgi:hypothetical protein